MNAQRDRLLDLVETSGGEIWTDDGSLIDLLAGRLQMTPMAVATAIRGLQIERHVGVERMSATKLRGIWTITDGRPIYHYRPKGYTTAAVPDETPRLFAPEPVEENWAQPAQRAARAEPVGPMFVRAADLELSQMSILWRNRIPRGALTVIAGYPGMGKSSLETAIAAELSQEGHVGIISNLEDDPESVTGPRLQAADAVMEKVLLLRADRAPRLPKELDRLEQIIIDTDSAYVILDPIGAHFYPTQQVHNRGALAELMQIARSTDVAIIGLHHTTKVPTTIRGQDLNINAMDVIGGPLGGLGGAARAVYLYGYDPSHVDRRALACAKLNGLDQPPALITEHETVELRANGRLFGAGHIRFVDEANIDPERVMIKGEKHPDLDAEVAEWLTFYLASGAACSRQHEELRKMGEKNGYGWATIQRAITSIGALRRRMSLNGKDNMWFWQLAEDHPLRKQKATIQPTPLHAVPEPEPESFDPTEPVDPTIDGATPVVPEEARE